MSIASDPAPPGIRRVRARNPSPLTLDGTNTYLVDGWVVDPGPDDDLHRAAILDRTGGHIEGIVLTHGHGDHADGAGPLAERCDRPPIVRPAEGEEVGPFTAVATPGHSTDSVCLLRGAVCFSGDTVLGAGSVFVAPGEGSLSAYLASLRRLREVDLEVLCPGHGPFVHDPRGRIDEYIAHRLDRERRLVEAIDRGARTHDEMLDAAWTEVPDDLRPAARVTLEAHLEKLRGEGRLPADVEAAGQALG